jgi:hypothetical protein
MCGSVHEESADRSARKFIQIFAAFTTVRAGASHKPHRPREALGQSKCVWLFQEHAQQLLGMRSMKQNIGSHVSKRGCK